MNRPVAELSDRVDASAIRRLREVSSVSGFSTVVSDGSSSTVDAARVRSEVGREEWEANASCCDFDTTPQGAITSRAATAAVE